MLNWLCRQCRLTKTSAHGRQTTTPGPGSLHRPGQHPAVNNLADPAWSGLSCYSVANGDPGSSTLSAPDSSRSTWARGRPQRDRDAARIDPARRRSAGVWSVEIDEVVTRILRHLGRLRALATGFGETHVQPVLFSTQPSEERAELRCRAYEIAALDGERLLGILDADVQSRSPGRLLCAITDGNAGAPGPGMVG